MIHVGFTGTQQGMTGDQEQSFVNLIETLQIDVFHHGDCLGADEDAHYNVMQRCPNASIFIHPPRTETKRAFCRGADVVRPAKEYLDRNQDIVDECDLLIATPSTHAEQLRSGTWATVRRARKKPIHIYIVWPNGGVTYEPAR